jgi:hypothetical protein
MQNVSRFLNPDFSSEHLTLFPSGLLVRIKLCPLYAKTVLIWKRKELGRYWKTDMGT